jgi:hypothetical protein
VVTVVFPHDISWMPAEPAAAAAGIDHAPASSSTHSAAADGLASAAATQINPGGSQQQQQQRLADSPAACQLLKDCAAALRAAPRGKAALLLGGTALLDEGAVNCWSTVGQLLVNTFLYMLAIPCACLLCRCAAAATQLKDNHQPVLTCNLPAAHCIASSPMTVKTSLLSCRWCLLNCRSHRCKPRCLAAV